MKLFYAFLAFFIINIACSKSNINPPNPAAARSFALSLDSGAPAWIDTSGNFMPDAGATDNASTATFQQDSAHFIRSGNNVIVTGRVRINKTDSAGPVRIWVGVPFPGNGNTQNVLGTASIIEAWPINKSYYLAGVVYGGGFAGRAFITFIGNTNGACNTFYTYQYTIKE